MPPSHTSIKCSLGDPTKDGNEAELLSETLPVLAELDADSHFAASLLYDATVGLKKVRPSRPERSPLSHGRRSALRLTRPTRGAGMAMATSHSTQARGWRCWWR